VTGPDTESVLRVLNSIIDPCSLRSGVPAGLVDMGLVRDVCVHGTDGEPRNVSFSIGVTEPGCFMAAPFATEARERLLSLDGIDSVDVTLIPWSDWTEHDMAQEYRLRLEEVRSKRRATVETVTRQPTSAV
jgi:metal-sulfur cluster biosynthetic enzyme